MIGFAIWVLYLPHNKAGSGIYVKITKMEQLAPLVPCPCLSHTSQNGTSSTKSYIPFRRWSDSPRQTQSSGVRQSNSVSSNTSRGRKEGNVGKDCRRPFWFPPALMSWREAASVTGMRELVDTPISSSSSTRLWEEYCRLRLKGMVNGYLSHKIVMHGIHVHVRVLAGWSKMPSQATTSKFQSH